MKQQSQTRTQRLVMLFTLLALVVVIAKNVAAETKWVAVKKDKTEQCSKGIVKGNVISLAADIQDLPWSPLLNFFR